MSFQFPANPADGDIVVRDNLLATYDAATNTWAVGEIPTYPGVPGPVGPQGPIGPKGDPGEGVNVTGVVESQADLPNDPDPNTFWLVTDDNLLFFWDGTTWYNVGGPFQGPQGEQGLPGTNGTNGTNGINGKGWYGNAVSTANGEYRITFLSNDGLTFTTGDLTGPPGETILPVATESTLGGIKVGRGLAILDDGTLQAGRVDVSLETAPIEAYGYNLMYEPISFRMADLDSNGNYVTQTIEGGAGTSAGTQYLLRTNSSNSAPLTHQITMPGEADAALCYMFASSTMRPGLNYTNEDIYAFRAYLQYELTLTNATYRNDSADTSTTMILAPTHNMACAWNASTVEKRTSNLPYTKIFNIAFAKGSTVTFNLLAYTIANNWGNTRVTSYPVRFQVIPYQTKDKVA